MASAEALYQKVMAATMYGEFAPTTTSSATATSTPRAFQVYWDNHAIYSLGNSPGQLPPVPVKMKAAAPPATPKANTNLAWLDQRVNEMRVRL